MHRHSKESAREVNLRFYLYILLPFMFGDWNLDFTMLCCGVREKIEEFHKKELLLYKTVSLVEREAQ